MAATIDGTNGITTPLDIEIQGSSSGSITLAAPAVAGSNTQTLVATTGTLAPIVSGAAVASTSGTSVDFNGVPSWVNRITVMLNNVSTNGSSIIQIRLGAGSITTSGYKSTASFGLGGVNQYAVATTGFIIDTSYASSSLTRTGCYILNLIGSNIWVGSGNFGGDATGQVTFACAGGVTLGGTLDRVRVTTVNGTDTFDAGTINILYE